MNSNSLSITLAVLVAEGMISYDRAEKCQKKLGDKLVPRTFREIVLAIQEALREET